MTTQPQPAAIEKMLGDPTDEEVAQFLKEYDEGKHPLSDADKHALATGGFRQYLQASIRLAQLEAEVVEVAKDKTLLDWMDSGTDIERFEKRVAVQINYAAMGRGATFRLAIYSAMDNAATQKRRMRNETVSSIN